MLEIPGNLAIMVRWARFVMLTGPREKIADFGHRWYLILNCLRQRYVKYIWLFLVPAVFAAEPVPRLSSINFYGLHRVPESRIQKVLGVREGDPMPPSKGALEDRLEKIPGVVLARLQAVCCEGPRGMLF